ncbi:Citrate synthase 1 [Botrimarina colliarenosi]|uniref:Citrate synthase n=1 Tax=Botrimarina colliarenosi TaxID=2528001 RepID=A0A5C6AI55_9BACT|nr:citrate synthase [Botrimarina colliarenosi]TWT99090.1 Citrate synthase 1 [Botrimarina colliarenosi]
MADAAKLTIGEKTLELPLIVGTENEVGLDISKLRAQTGAITVDEGFVNTGSTESAITFLNGEEGILRYRGYAIETLAENCDFVEVCYLLLHGELPDAAQIDAFRTDLRQHSMLHEDMRKFFDGFQHDAHPMAILSSVIHALSTFYADSLDVNNPDHVHRCSMRLLAKAPTIAAYAHKKSIGQPYVYPDNELGYCENFLQMMFSVPAEKYEISKVAAKALNLLLIVHADHEQNCSTSTVRMVGSSDANLFASISAGVAALSGPLHGGANEACVAMLDQIRDDGADVEKYVDMAKDKSNGFRLMGFGHRVYKSFDPRAQIIKQVCHDLIEEGHINDPIFEIAKKLEQVALTDEYFVERKLYPNVDFYSGVIYRALGIPVEMFTVLFAIGRMPGWIAHWQEMRDSPGKRIYRPRQIYTGPTERDFVALKDR